MLKRNWLVKAQALQFWWVFISCWLNCLVLVLGTGFLWNCDFSNLNKHMIIYIQKTLHILDYRRQFFCLLIPYSPQTGERKLSIEHVINWLHQKVRDAMLMHYVHQVIYTLYTCLVLWRKLIVMRIFSPRCLRRSKKSKLGIWGLPFCNVVQIVTSRYLFHYSLSK